MANDKFLTKALSPKFQSAMSGIYGIICSKDNFSNMIEVTVCFEGFNANAYLRVYLDDQNTIDDAISKLKIHRKRLYNFANNTFSSSVFQLHDKWKYEHPQSDTVPTDILVGIYNKIISYSKNREDVLLALDIVDLERGIEDYDYVLKFCSKFFKDEVT